MIEGFPGKVLNMSDVPFLGKCIKSSEGNMMSFQGEQNFSKQL